MNNNNSSSGKGIGFCGLLTIAFIVLKLTGIINWSWFSVFSPIWIPLLLFILFAVFVIIINLLRTKHKRGGK